MMSPRTRPALCCLSEAVTNCEAVATGEAVAGDMHRDGIPNSSSDMRLWPVACWLLTAVCCLHLDRDS